MSRLIKKLTPVIKTHILGCSCLCFLFFTAVFLLAPSILKCVLLACVLLFLPAAAVARKKFPRVKTVCTVLISLLIPIALSLTVTLVSYDLFKAPVRHLAQEGETVELEGYTEEKIYAVSFSSMYQMKITRLDGKRVFGVSILVTFSPDDEPGMYEYFKGQATLSSPKSTDPTFDSASYYRSKGIFAACDGSNLEYTGKQARVPGKLLYTVRRELSEYIASHAEGLPQAMIHALLLGDKGFMPDTLKRDMRTLGISHMLAVSGLHLSVLSAFISFILKRLKLAMKARCAVMILFVLTYMTVCGFAVSVVRAGIMLIFYLTACLLDEKNSSGTSLLFSGALIVFFSPFSLLDCGFLMSFLATCSILLFSAYSRERRVTRDKYALYRALFESLGISVAAQVAVMPVSLFVFDGMSVAAPLSTLLFTPFLSLLLYFIPVLLLLWPIPGLSHILSEVFSLLCSLFESMASLARYIKDLYTDFTNPAAIALAVFLAVFTLALFLKSKRKKRAGLLLIFYLLLSVLAVLPHQFGKQTVLTSVNGKNDILIVCEKGESCLVDLSDGSKKNLKIAVDLLKEQTGDHTPDKLLLTHYHQRHVQSFIYLCENYYPKTLYLPLPFEENENEQGLYEVLLETAKKYGVKTVTYQSDEEVCGLPNITLSNFKRAYLKRSTHPVLSFDILIFQKRLSYFSSSSLEVFTPDENANVYLGVHGPIIKQKLDETQNSTQNFFFATKTLAEEYGAKEGKVCSHPTGLQNWAFKETAPARRLLSLQSPYGVETLWNRPYKQEKYPPQITFFPKHLPQHSVVKTSLKTFPKNSTSYMPPGAQPPKYRRQDF